MKNKELYIFINPLKKMHMDKFFDLTISLKNELAEKTSNAKLGDVLNIKGIKLKVDLMRYPHLFCKDCFFFNHDWACEKVKCLPSERDDKLYVTFREIKTRS